MESKKVIECVQTILGAVDVPTWSTLRGSTKVPLGSFDSAIAVGRAVLS